MPVVLFFLGRERVVCFVVLGDMVTKAGVNMNDALGCHVCGRSEFAPVTFNMAGKKKEGLLESRGGKKPRANGDANPSASPLHPPR